MRRWCGPAALSCSTGLCGSSSLLGHVKRRFFFVEGAVIICPEADQFFFAKVPRGNIGTQHPVPVISVHVLMSTWARISSSGSMNFISGHIRRCRDRAGYVGSHWDKVGQSGAQYGSAAAVACSALRGRAGFLRASAPGGGRGGAVLPGAGAGHVFGPVPGRAAVFFSASRSGRAG